MKRSQRMTIKLKWVQEKVGLLGIYIVWSKLGKLKCGFNREITNINLNLVTSCLTLNKSGFIIWFKRRNVWEILRHPILLNNLLSSLPFSPPQTHSINIPQNKNHSQHLYWSGRIGPHWAFTDTCLFNTISPQSYTRVAGISKTSTESYNRCSVLFSRWLASCVCLLHQGCEAQGGREHQTPDRRISRRLIPCENMP